MALNKKTIARTAYIITFLGFVSLILLIINVSKAFLEEMKNPTLAAKTLIDSSIHTNDLHELCYAHSYSVLSSANNDEFKVGERIIHTLDVNSAPNDHIFVIVGLKNNTEIVSFMVDKRTLLQYFNESKDNACVEVKS